MNAVLAFTLALAVAVPFSSDVEAKRLGSSGSQGVQRQQSVPGPTSPATAQPAAPAAAPSTLPNAAAPAAAGAAASASKGWTGPLMAAAAGLGLVALASHLGLGEALGAVMLAALVGLVALIAVSVLLQRRRTIAPSVMAAAPAGASAYFTPQQLPGGSASPRSQPFDAATFAQNAKKQFMALQAANDRGDLAELREYLCTDLLRVVEADVAARDGAPQHTEVYGLSADVVSVHEEDDFYLVSVRFTGSVREHAAQTPNDLNEVWHLRKPRVAAGGWVVVGIQQL